MISEFAESNTESSTPEPVKPGLAITNVSVMQRLLLILGCLFLAGAAAWPWLSRIPFGRLPGDIHIARGGFSFYFPITTCILVSLLLSGLIWLLRR